MESLQLESSPSLKKRATANVAVKNRESDRYDQFGGIDLVELRLRESFSGEMDGESEVRALQVIKSDGSVRQLSLQSFRGSLDGAAAHSFWRDRAQ